MKKLLYPFAFILAAFLILYSCSAEEEDNTPPPNIIQTPEPEPQAPTQYNLSVSAGGGGTVSTEGGTYDEGTEVTITATPDDGYEFVGWEGSDSSEDSLTITLTGDSNVTALFEQIYYEALVTNITIEKSINSQLYQLQDQFTFKNVAGSFHYKSNTGDFLVFAGLVVGGPGDPCCEGIITATDTPAASTVVLKKDVNGWNYHKAYKNVSTWNIRNYKVKNNLIVMGDGNELGQEWKGDAWLGKIEGDEINWERVNNDDTMHYFHGITFGDINFDGKYDAIGGPAISEGYQEYYYPIFLQNNDGTFKRDNNTIIDYPRDENGLISLSGHEYGFEMADVFDDNKEELIIAGSSPGAITPENAEERSFWIEKNIHKLKIYGFNNEKQKYVLKWESNTPYAFYPKGQDIERHFDATSIRTGDLNNDGFIDVVVSREYPYNDEEPYLSFETWINNGNKTFSPHFVKIFETNKTEFREIELIDADRDGFLDVVLKGNKHHYISDNWEERFEGIKINKLIWINDGTGRYHEYDKKELILKNIYPEHIMPYISNNEFFIAGPSATKQFSFDWEDVQVKMFDIKLRL